MPFKTNAELPNWIKKAFSEKVQDVYRNAFNSTYEKTKDDGRASAAAISAVKKMGYVKKGDNWVKAEAGYVKDLGLKPGEYIHPNDPDKKLTITVDGLNDVIANTQKFLNAGGKVPLTVSHPNTEGEKIDATLGQMVDIWFDPMTQMPYGHFDFLPESEVNNWVKEGKLTEVSPGIYHDVITSAGKFASLIDHVAATSSPFNLGQSGFMPINAFKRYNSAYLFFENKYVSEEKGVVEKIAAFINDKFIEYWGQREHNTSQEGGDEMELKEALEKITELESDVKVLKGENETLKGENEAYKKKETERVETEKTVRKDTFSKKVDELIKLERVKPANRDGLIANFEFQSTPLREG
jgi:cation transport regulator ChaB